MHPSLIHADRLRLCDDNREKLYSRHFVPSTKVKTGLKRDRKNQAANAAGLAARQQSRTDEQIDNNLDRKTDHRSAESVGRETAAQHLLPRRLLSSRREGMTEERNTTPTSQSALGLPTTLRATEQQNITDDEAKAADQQKKLFPTRVILPTKRPKATRNVTNGTSSSLAEVTDSAQSDNSAQLRQQAGLGNGWFSIQKILKHQKRGNKMFYQVLWDDDSTSWKPKRDVSKFAVDSYWIAKNNRSQTRKRRRRM